MNEETPEDPCPGIEPMEEDVEESTEQTPEASPAQEAMAPSDTLSTAGKPSSPPEEGDPGQAEGEEAKAAGGEPPVDWFEPLEDDDEANSVDRNDGEGGSLAGESEKSGSVAGSEIPMRKMFSTSRPQRKRAHPEEGWEEWPILGEGWKRKEVVRRSGSSVGQKDVYYFSPRGYRVRSKVELGSMLEGHFDLASFDYKSGKFYNGDPPPTRVRHKKKRKIQERSDSESSWMERGEGADTPDSQHRLTPSLGPKNLNTIQTSLSSNSRAETPNQSLVREDPPAEDKIRIRLPPPSISKPNPTRLPSINGDIWTEDSTLVCSRCGISFTGTWYDKQRKRPCCPTCWASKTKEHPLIRSRKWIPCGQCVGCHNTNCGQCDNCKHERGPESRRRICRKRKCLCPIRKNPGSVSFLRPPYEFPEVFSDSKSQSEVTDSQNPSHKSSDTENFSVNIDVDDEDDMSTDDDDDWHKKRKRRSCGECKACLCRKDCGTCDFCIDKPKFGGSNKKRQKCRLRQCQRQAMRHLLPFQMGQGECGPGGAMLPGRPRPHYTYSRKSTFSKNKGPVSGMDLSDNEGDDSNLSAMNLSVEPASGSRPSYELDVRHHKTSMQQLNYFDYEKQNGVSDTALDNSNHKPEQNQRSRREGERSRKNRNISRHVEEDDDDEDMDEEDDEDEDEEDEEEEDEDEEEEEDEEDKDEELPLITQIFSLADNIAGSGVDMENQLMKLLHGLRSSVLPVLWYAIIVEGPQLQLIQCSKQSSMTDTAILIDPGFCYQITVQKQPLLPTHPLYDKYPARLTSVADVVNLLLGLEKYTVCQGLPPKRPFSSQDPLILERASTCDFLVKRKVSICANCRGLQRL